MNINKVRECIGLLNSMILSGEDHEETSRKAVEEALAELSRPSVNALLPDIDLALLANNGGGGTEWKKELCLCDASVGMAPCQYCAIHSALIRSKKLIEDSSRDELLTTLRQYLSMASLDGQSERQQLRAKLSTLMAMTPVLNRDLYMENYEYDCGHPCTENGCPGHDSGVPISITFEGVRLSVDGADAGDFPSADKKENERVVDVMNKLWNILNNGERP